MAGAAVANNKKEALPRRVLRHIFTVLHVFMGLNVNPAFLVLQVQGQPTVAGTTVANNKPTHGTVLYCKNKPTHCTAFLVPQVQGQPAVAGTTVDQNQALPLGVLQIGGGGSACV